MVLELKTEEKQMLLKIVDRLPPKNTFFLYTEEQQAYWFEVRKKFAILHDFFQAYFAGEELPIENLKGHSKDFYPALFDYFLAFYNLIQCGWKPICEESQSIYKITFPFDKPGDCFIAFLEKQAQAQLHICEMGRYDITPRNRYKMRRLAKKVESGKANNIQKLNYEKYIKSIENLGFREFAELEIFCVVTCIKHASRNRRLKVNLKDYFQKFEEMEKISQRQDRTRRAYAWESGKILYSEKRGGTYK